jgi:hypothetical protein
LPWSGPGSGSGSDTGSGSGSGLIPRSGSARGKSHPKSATEARRKKVLELNQMGKSNGAIARELRCGTKTVRKDLRFFQQNGDNIIDPGQRRIQSKWYKAIEGVIAALPYFTSRGIKPSLRTMFYRLEAQGYINKTEHDYHGLVRHSVSARQEENIKKLENFCIQSCL